MLVPYRRTFQKIVLRHPGPSSAQTEGEKMGRISQVQDIDNRSQLSSYQLSRTRALLVRPGRWRCPAFVVGEVDGGTVAPLAPVVTCTANGTGSGQGRFYQPASLST
jgi:hypothetical protein